MEKEGEKNPDRSGSELAAVDVFGIDLGNGVNLEMVRIPAGMFVMGSPVKEKFGFAIGRPVREMGALIIESPQTKVKIDGFWLGKYEITQSQYMAIMGTNPSFFTGDNNPVDSVSWLDALEFCRRLSEKTGESFTLPTEAQWEYACRAGTKTPYSRPSLEKCGWFKGNSGETTHPVGQKEPNAWGLFDMHGNLWEWCLTLFKVYPYSETDGRNGFSDKENLRIVRGGCYSEGAGYCRSAARYASNPQKGFDDSGFRVACSMINSNAIKRSDEKLLF